MSSKLKLELRQPGSRGYTQTHATEYLPYSLRRKRGSACMLLERGSGGRGVRETADILGSLVFQDAEVSTVLGRLAAPGRQGWSRLSCSAKAPAPLTCA